MISDFVVRMHRYRSPKEQDGDVLPMGGNFADKLSTFSAEAENEVSLLIRYKCPDLCRNNIKSHFRCQISHIRIDPESRFVCLSYIDPSTKLKLEFFL